jgi:hypothetical protein
LQDRGCWLLLPLLCTVPTTTAPINTSSQLNPLLLQACAYLTALLLLLLTVSDVHASLDASCKAVDEPAVHSAKHGVTARHCSSNLHSNSSTTIQPCTYHTSFE